MIKDNRAKLNQDMIEADYCWKNPTLSRMIEDKDTIKTQSRYDRGELYSLMIGTIKQNPIYFSGCSLLV